MAVLDSNAGVSQAFSAHLYHLKTAVSTGDLAALKKEGPACEFTILRQHLSDLLAHAAASPHPEMTLNALVESAERLNLKLTDYVDSGVLAAAIGNDKYAEAFPAVLNIAKEKDVFVSALFVDGAEAVIAALQSRDPGRRLEYLLRQAAAEGVKPEGIVAAAQENPKMSPDHRRFLSALSALIAAEPGACAAGT